MMPIPVLELAPPPLTATKKNRIVYSVMIQSCLCFTLIILFFFTSSRHFYSSPFSSSVSNPKSEKLDNLKLDLNHSAYGELAQIPGIGKSIALEIVNYRKVFGGFNSIDEIEGLKGLVRKPQRKLGGIWWLQGQPRLLNLQHLEFGSSLTLLPGYQFQMGRLTLFLKK